jgi:hypothetical protein
MSLIENFTKIYGKRCTDGIYSYMIENDILNEFEKIIDKPTELFNFAVRYGIIEIVRYLYEQQNIEYDHDLILGFNTTLKSDVSTNQSTINQPVTTGSSNDSLKLQIIDKFSRNRNICIKYLIDMKRYSSHRCNNKRFYYRFNPKYINLFA